MENTQEQKTPEQWFQMLKEPYRSEAIANIDTEYTYYEETTKSLKDAIQFSFDWLDSRQRHTYWSKIYNSIRKGETTYLEPETLKPEQMESGKWYVIKTSYEHLSKINEAFEGDVSISQSYNLSALYNEGGGYLITSEIQSIRHATKEEVLKYFPDEVFEPIELRPEDLVVGEVYTAKVGDDRYTFKFDKLIDRKSNPLVYSSMYNHQLKRNVDSDCMSITDIKFHHATHIEKALLLGEPELIDWEDKYKELKKDYDTTQINNSGLYNNLVEQINKYNDLNAKFEELKAKYDQLEPKGEKVYFYMDDNIGVKCGYLQTALDNSKNNNPIYEAYCIGKKKSVLVNETT